MRNPFDRFVSYCAFMTRGNGAFLADAQSVMRHVLFESRPGQHVLFQPQHTFVADADGNLLTDLVGRVEQVRESFDAVCACLGLLASELGQVNASRRGIHRDYYDQTLIDAVADLHRRNLELFDFQY